MLFITVLATCIVVAPLLAQQRGMFRTLVGLLPVRALTGGESKACDSSTSESSNSTGRIVAIFCLSTAIYFAGWMADTLEILPRLASAWNAD